MTDTAKKVAYDALREMYERAEPPLDFDHVLDNPDEYDDGWFGDYYLDEEEQREIVDSYLEDASLTSWEEAAVIFTVILDFGPSSTLNNQ